MALWTKYHADGREVKSGWICDSCDGWNTRSTNYCPHCGERMKGRMGTLTCTTIDNFIAVSDWNDWVNQTTESVYIIYWQWCVKNNSTPAGKIAFMKQVLERIPELKSAPCNGKRYFRLS